MLWTWANSGATPTQDPGANVVLVTTVALAGGQHTFFIFIWAETSIAVDFQLIDTNGTTILKSQRSTMVALQKAIFRFPVTKGQKVRLVNVDALTNVKVQASINYGE